jgi:small-conductance mechanosensitive channel
VGLISGLTTLAPTRTPVPTATPDVVAAGVAEIIREIGLSGKRVLGLRYDDWINLLVSPLYVILGYLIGTWLTRRLLPRLVRRTETVLDDRLLQVSGSQVRWLAAAIILRWATKRLSLLDAEVKTWSADLHFILTVGLAVVILWRLIDVAAQEAETRIRKAKRHREAAPLITLSVWTLRLLVIILVLSISLGYFGINITGFAIVLVATGLAFSLAGRDILADIISGAFILVDRPYRIGDRIDLPKIDSWGDVVAIGMRSTRILTLDNRTVTVPNSQVGRDQIVNYSLPDPSYYDTSEVVVAYDNDVEQVGQLLVDGVRSVEGVRKERQTDALLMTFTENYMVFRIGWWIASIDDFFPLHDRVNRAVIQALREAGVVLPYATGSLSVTVNSDQGHDRGQRRCHQGSAGAMGLVPAYGIAKVAPRVGQPNNPSVVSEQ